MEAWWLVSGLCGGAAECVAGVCTGRGGAAGMRRCFPRLNSSVKFGFSAFLFLKKVYDAKMQC